MMPEQPRQPRQPSGTGLDAGARILFVKLPYVITGTLMLLAIAINFANVIARYLFASAIFWTEEVLGYIMIYSVFLAAVTIAFNGANLNMDLVSSKFAGRLRQIVNGAILISFLACCAFMVFQSYRVVALHLRNETTSVAAAIPMALPHSALLVGFALMGAAILYRWKAYIQGRFE